MSAAEFVVVLFGMVGIAAVGVSLWLAPRVTVLATSKRFPERRPR